jgi:competence protein ComEC
MPKLFNSRPLCFIALALAVLIAILGQFFVIQDYNLPDFGAGVRDEVLQYTRWYFHKFFTDENAELLYSMTFGDRAGLSYGLRYDFNLSGLAHVLAVSGMNVGLIYLLLNFVFRLVKMPKKARIWIAAPVLIFYTYLCGWQYPILRATIMFLTFAFAKHKQANADNLSVLCLSAIIILCIFPASLRSVSFQLSYACMFGIIAFYGQFKKLFYVSSIAMFLATTVTTLPLLICYFGYIPTYALISSVILLPVISLVFNVGIVALVTVIGGCLLWLAEPLLTFVRNVSNNMAQLPFAKIEISAGNLGYLFYFLGLIILSRYVFLKKSIKLPLAGICGLLYVWTLLI